MRKVKNKIGLNNYWYALIDKTDTVSDTYVIFTLISQTKCDTRSALQSHPWRKFPLVVHQWRNYLQILREYSRTQMLFQPMTNNWLKRELRFPC